MGVPNIILLPALMFVKEQKLITVIADQIRQHLMAVWNIGLIVHQNVKLLILITVVIAQPLLASTVVLLISAIVNLSVRVVMQTTAATEQP